MDRPMVRIPVLMVRTIKSLGSCAISAIVSCMGTMSRCPVRS